jgi:glycerol-3-phosphate acyltransferase PlsY
MQLALSVIGAYLIGSIPVGFLVARYGKKIDLRTQGSGNVGATNVYRTAGKLPALFTLIFDILKGYACVTVLGRAAYHESMGIGMTPYLSLMGLCVVIGHNWTVFLRFRGGKGIATSAGVLLGLCPALLLIGLVSWVAVFTATRIVSIASLLAAAIIPAATLLVPTRISIQLLTFALSVLTIYRHKKNIKRLMTGEEKELRVKSSKS